MAANIASTSSLIENVTIAMISETANLPKDNRQVFSIQPSFTSKLNLSAFFNDINAFFKSFLDQDALIGKLGILAHKTVEFIKSEWDIVVATICLIAASFFVVPAIPLLLLEITVEFTLGFATGIVLTHFFSEKLKPLIDRLRSTNTTLQAAVITISTALAAPVGIFIAGFTIGNEAYGQLNQEMPN